MDILDLLDSAFFVPCVMLLFLSPSIWEMRVVWYDTLPPHDTPFVLMPVWGGVDSRPNDILGVFYQHQTTQEHCSSSYWSNLIQS